MSFGYFLSDIHHTLGSSHSEVSVLLVSWLSDCQRCVAGPVCHGEKVPAGRALPHQGQTSRETAQVHSAKVGLHIVMI